MESANQKTESFLRLPAVKEVTGLGRSTIYNRVKEGKFPRPIKLTGSRVSVWLRSEIHEWVASEIEAARGDQAAE